MNLSGTNQRATSPPLYTPQRGIEFKNEWNKEDWETISLDSGRDPVGIKGRLSQIFQREHSTTHTQDLRRAVALTPPSAFTPKPPPTYPPISVPNTNDPSEPSLFRHFFGCISTPRPATNIGGMIRLQSSLLERFVFCCWDHQYVLLDPRNCRLEPPDFTRPDRLEFSPLNTSLRGARSEYQVDDHVQPTDVLRGANLAITCVEIRGWKECRDGEAYFYMHSTPRQPIWVGDVLELRGKLSGDWRVAKITYDGWWMRMKLQDVDYPDHVEVRAFVDQVARM
ncbi:hypothetical protein C8F01DRAFT_1228371 [Mycena amicta]|nr:hypothetical protein C8F01DRAFT_1228371 [Mycena amicta]